MASSALDPRLQYGNHQSNAFDAPSAFMHAPQPSQRQPLPPAQSIGVPPNTSGQQPYSQDDEHRPFLDSADHNVEDHTDDEQHESPETQADDEGHQHTSPSKAQDAKRPRACDSCRGLKVRCILDPTSGQPCKRCAKARRQCIVTPPTRKRQKKADSRVAELEKKIDTLTAALRAQNVALAEGFDGQGEGIQCQTLPKLPGERIDQLSQRFANPSDSHVSAVPRKKRRIDSDSNSRAQSPPPADEETIRREILDQDNGAVIVTTNNYNERKPVLFDHSDIDGKIDAAIDGDTAERLFNRYVKEFASQFPAVVFPPDATAKQIRAQKPVLFLAIMSSTSYGLGIPRDAQRMLQAELREVFADSLWRNAEKSLELIQALQVATLWYRPPSNFEQHMFYQTVHMATIMAMDIGMGRRQHVKRRAAAPMEDVKILANTDTAEVRRAWLTCYVLCISITMILRRPNLLRWSDYMQECVDYLETAPDGYPSDILFCQHVKLAHIAEEVATTFSFDDTCSSASMADQTVIFGIKRFERDLHDRIRKDTPNPALNICEHVTNLYIHEIALHSKQSDGDLKPNGDADDGPAQGVVGTDHADAVRELSRSCRATLDSYLAYDVDALYMLPIIFSVRTVYATVVLLKLYIAATSPGEMMNVITKDELKLPEYLQRLVQHFQKIMDLDSQIPHAKFLFVLQRINERYVTLFQENEKRQTANQSRQEPALPPLRVQGMAASQQPAQGLHLLSEVAMGGAPGLVPTQNETPNPHAMPATRASGQGTTPQTGQPWYPPTNVAAMQRGVSTGMAMDPMAYGLYNGQFSGFDNFDFSLGGMGLDGDMYGGFGHGSDQLWDFSDPALTGQYQGWV